MLARGLRRLTLAPALALSLFSSAVARWLGATPQRSEGQRIPAPSRSDLDILFANGEFTNGFEAPPIYADYRDRVFLNDGTGVFTEHNSPSNQLSAIEDFSSGFCVHDFNGDGNYDVLVKRRASQSVRGSRVDRRFAPPNDCATGTIAGGDCDAGTYVPTNSLFIGDGLGGFAFQGTTALENDPDPFTVCADVDGDGDIDCVMSNAVGGSAGLFLNDGSGSFGTAGTAILPAPSHRPLRFADIDGDG